MNDYSSPVIRHIHGFDERDEHETEARGVYDHAVVEFASGARYPVCFYDAVRLAQDLSSGLEQGEPCLAEPGLIVVPAITPANMQKAVEFLAGRRFFDKLVPLGD